MSTKTEEKKYLKFYQKLAYGSGDLASNCSYGLVSSFLLIYLTSIMGMDSGVIGTLMLLSKLLDGVTDVFFGAMIDRTKSKMGKARPWMLFGQIGVSVCLIALFAIPVSIGLTAQYVYFFVFYTSLNAIFYTANGIAYSALTSLITKNSVERVQLGSFRFMFAVVTNIVIGFAVTSLVAIFGGGAAGWRSTAIIFALAALVVNTISCLAVKEVSDESVVDKKGDGDDKIGFVETAKLLAKNKYYLIIVAIYIVYYIMSNLVTGSGAFFATFVLGDEGIFGMLNLMKMFPVIIALILSPIIIKKVGNMQKVNTIAYGISCLLGIPLIYAAVTRNVGLLLGVMFVKGIFGGFLSGSLNAFIAEISTYTTKTTGIHMDGTMYSCSSLGVKIGGGIGTAAVGWLLKLGGFVGTATTQTVGATNMILWIYIVIPVIIGVIITILLSKLDVEKANHRWDEEHGKKNLSKNWKFCKGCVSSLAILAMSGKKPDIVDLPHDAMIFEKRTPETKNGAQTGFYPGGTYTYFKDVEVPEEWKNKEVILEFEGVYETAMVYINGALVATNLYGYSNFFVELNSYLNYGETNEIKVIADNSSEENTRWYSGSGIYRYVNLYVGNREYIKPMETRLTTIVADKEKSRLKLQTECFLDNDGQYQIQFVIKAAEAEIAKKIIESHQSGLFEDYIDVTNVSLWDCENPFLYNIEISLWKDGQIIDTETFRYGIRTVEVNPSKGFLLNGKMVNLRGTCLHHDNGITGAATFFDAEYRKIDAIYKAGFNSVRSSHHPISNAMLEICDELGILVMDELFDMWTVHKNKKDFSLHFLNEWESVTTRMVKKDYNHPCVVMYSIGNEISELGTKRGVEISQLLCQKLHELDNTRFTTCGVNGLNAAGKKLFQILKDVAPLIEKKEKEASPDEKGQAMGSNALNSIMEFMSGKAGDTFACHPLLTEAIAGVSEATDIIGLNYMTGRHMLEATIHPDKTVVGTETFPADIYRLWKLVSENAHIIGDFTWTGYDYLGEAGCGIFYYNGYKNFGSAYPDRLAYIGDISITGIRRPISYYREVVYGLRKEPYIAVERMNRNGQKASKTPWMFKDNISSWTWTGYEGEKASVDVYSDAEEVELFLNGVSVGRESTKEYIAHFEVEYKFGELKAIDYVEGKERARYTLVTAKPASRLAVAFEKTEIRANGDDLCYVDINLADSNGVMNPQFEKRVKVLVEGAGTLQGLGSGNPSNEEDYFANECTTFDGNALACVRAGHEPGEITITIECEDFETIMKRIKVI